MLVDKDSYNRMKRSMRTWSNSSSNDYLTDNGVKGRIIMAKRGDQFCGWCVAWLGVLSSSIAIAGDPLEFIPAEAVVVTRIGPLDGLADDTFGMLHAILPKELIDEIAESEAMWAKSVGEAVGSAAHLENDPKAVDLSRPIYTAMLPVEVESDDESRIDLKSPASVEPFYAAQWIPVQPEQRSETASAANVGSQDLENSSTTTETAKKQQDTSSVYGRALPMPDDARLVPGSIAIDRPPRQPVAYYVVAQDATRLQRAVLGVEEDSELVIKHRNDGIDAVTSEQTTWYFAKHGEWIVYTPVEDCIPLLLAAADPPKESFAKVIDDSTKQVLETGDFAAVVNLGEGVEACRHELEASKAQAQAWIRSAFGEGGTFTAELESQGVDLEDGRLLIEDFVDKGLDAIMELRWLAVNVNIEESGLHGDTELTVAAGGILEPILKQYVPSRLDTLARLPQGAALYCGNTASPKVWLEFLDRLMKTEPEGPDRRMWAAAMKDLEAARPIERAVSVAAERQPGRGVLTVELTAAVQPDALREYKKYLVTKQPSKSSEHMGIKLKQWYEEGFGTLDGRSVDLITERREYHEPENEEDGSNGLTAPVSQAISKRVYGHHREIRQATVDQLLVRASGLGQENLRQYLAQLGSSEGLAGGNESFTAARAKLHDEANLIVLVDLKQALAGAIALAKEIPQAQMVLALLQLSNWQPPKQPTYSGLSVRIEPTRVKTRWFVPVSQLEYKDILLKLQASEFVQLERTQPSGEP